MLDDLLVWEGTRENPVEIATVERAVADAKRRFPGLQVLADPWQAEGSVQKLKRQGIRVQTFSFSGRSIAGLSRVLYECVSDASLRVFEDEELEQEILGLQVRETANGWRFDHRASGYSDRAVALAMALQGAVKTRRTGQPAHHVAVSRRAARSQAHTHLGSRSQTGRLRRLPSPSRRQRFGGVHPVSLSEKKRSRGARVYSAFSERGPEGKRLRFPVLRLPYESSSTDLSDPLRDTLGNDNAPVYTRDEIAATRRRIVGRYWGRR